MLLLVAPAGGSVAQPVSSGLSTCSLIVRQGDRYLDDPLPDFDPSKPQPLVDPGLMRSATGVLCRRDSIIPERADLRVLTELHVPLAIAEGQRLAWLIMVKGQLALNFGSGQANAKEQPTIQSRLDQMQADYNRIGMK